jgi:glycerol-3-phosphate acyltransferase PlsY
MAVVIAAYVIGAIPWGYLAGRVSKGIDLRTVGSGGTGATNVLRTLGGRASAIVVALDLLKGVIPVLAASWLGLGSWWVGAAAVATVAGHCWSPFIGFKGGKGVATGAGAAMALLPQIVLLVPVLALIVWRTRFVSLGSLVAAALASLLAVFLAVTQRFDWASATAIVIISGIISLRHHGNIERLLAGTERRIGEKVTV